MKLLPQCSTVAEGLSIVNLALDQELLGDVGLAGQDVSRLWTWPHADRAELVLNSLYRARVAEDGGSGISLQVRWQHGTLLEWVAFTQKLDPRLDALTRDSGENK